MKNYKDATDAQRKTLEFAIFKDNVQNGASGLIIDQCEINLSKGRVSPTYKEAKHFQFKKLKVKVHKIHAHERKVQKKLEEKLRKLRQNSISYAQYQKKLQELGLTEPGSPVL